MTTGRTRSMWTLTDKRLSLRTDLMAAMSWTSTVTGTVTVVVFED